MIGFLLGFAVGVSAGYYGWKRFGANIVFWARGLWAKVNGPR